VLWVDDPQAEVIGRLALNGRPGLVRKQDGAPEQELRRHRRTHIYAATMHLPPTLLRNIAREAGVHIYSDTDDACYADARYVALHAAMPGAKTIHLPGPRRVRDAIAGDVVAQETDRVTTQMDAGETVFLETAPLR
jgi:hypothetical protein